MDPRLVYRNNGPHLRPGGSFDYKLVSDEADHSEALESGWFDTLPEALDANPETAAPTRAELEAKALELGLKFDGRTGDRKLAAAIESALAPEPDLDPASTEEYVAPADEPAAAPEV